MFDQSQATQDANLAQAYLSGRAANHARQDLLALLCTLPWGAMPPAALSAAHRLMRFASGESPSLDAEFYVALPQPMTAALAHAYSQPKPKRRKGKARVKKPPTSRQEELISAFDDALLVALEAGEPAKGAAAEARVLVSYGWRWLVRNEWLDFRPRTPASKREAIRRLSKLVGDYRRRSSRVRMSAIAPSSIEPAACGHSPVVPSISATEASP